ncbi:MAG TPA: hypothetical protein VKG24_20260 [Pseudolabrys sp.]|jgi:hypothetical protein|nr:hypothetical protein [Pseudolabrys sp.]
MCHRYNIHVMLSAEEKKEVKKLSGIMVPVYASMLMALVVFVAVTGSARQGELMASTSAPAAAH